MPDRSLDDFLNGDTDASEGGDEDHVAPGDDDGAVADDEGGKPEGDADAAGDAPESTIAPTFRSSPTPEACPGCGESVTRLWHDDGAFVCADCKEW